MSKASPQVQASTALTVYTALKSNESQIAGWIPREMAPSSQDRQRVLGEVMRHADLQCRSVIGDGEITQSTAMSIYVAVITFAQARLIPNKALGLGYFVPFKGIITPIFGYKGLRQCVGREAGIRVAQAEVVVEGDRWPDSSPAGIPYDAEQQARLWSPGPNHVPDADPKTWIAAFSRMRWPDAFEDVFIMGGAELRARRNAAIGGKRSTPWNEWGLQMAAKTVLRRHCTSGRIEWAGDGFAPMADSLGEAGKMRQLAEMIAARESDASVQERDSLVQNAIDIDETETAQNTNGKRTLDDLAGAK